MLGSIHMGQGVFSMFQGMGFIILIFRTHHDIRLKYSGLKLPPLRNYLDPHIGEIE